MLIIYLFNISFTNKFNKFNRRKKNMKKILILLFASLFVSISSIASADLVFALVPKAMNNPFFDLARDGCKQAESEIDGVECL